MHDARAEDWQEIKTGGPHPCSLNVVIGDGHRRFLVENDGVVTEYIDYISALKHYHRLKDRMLLKGWSLSSDEIEGFTNMAFEDRSRDEKLRLLSALVQKGVDFSVHQMTWVLNELHDLRATIAAIREQVNGPSLVSVSEQVIAKCDAVLTSDDRESVECWIVDESRLALDEGGGYHVMVVDANGEQIPDLIRCGFSTKIAANEYAGSLNLPVKRTEVR